MNQRQKHTLVAALLALIGIVLILIVVWIVSRQLRFKEYVSEQYGFSIGYPATWEIREEIDGAAAAFLSPQDNALDTFRENVTVIIEPLTIEPFKLKPYTELAIRQVEEVFKENFILLQSGFTTLSGKPGHKIVFLGKGPDLEVKYMIVWMIDDLKAYKISYTSISSQYDRYALDIKRMLMSFHLD